MVEGSLPQCRIVRQGSCGLRIRCLIAEQHTVVAATFAYTRAIDRSSRAGYRSILLLTSLANTRADQSERLPTHLRQLGRLSGNHA